jgi:hypothetical protein
MTAEFADSAAHVPPVADAEAMAVLPSSEAAQTGFRNRAVQWLERIVLDNLLLPRNSRIAHKEDKQ